MKLPIDEGVEAEFSVLTLAIYEQEFDGADLMQDVLGKTVLSDEDAVLDFTATNWTKITQAAWAAIKTADDKLPSYRTWARAQSGLDVSALANAVQGEVFERFFPSIAAALKSIGGEG